MTKIESRFWKFVEKTTSCWLWTGSIIRGYGRFWNGSSGMYAHRFSLILHNINVPDGMVADHICRVRNCVNPAHLRIVTPRQNTLENSESVMAINSKKTHCPQGHPLSGDNLTPHKRARICLTCRRAQYCLYGQRKRDKAKGINHV